MTKQTKCDICGSTAVDHTELKCSINQTTMQIKSFTATELDQARKEERQKVLELIEKLPAMTLTNPNNNHPACAYKLVDKAELRRVIEQMGEE